MPGGRRFDMRTPPLASYPKVVSSWDGLISIPVPPSFLGEKPVSGM